jgi:AbrB family looped-hinge helix DNA binding protein
MQTIVTRRGQTVLPAVIRERYKIHDGDRLVWIDDGEGIHVIPIPADPVEGLYGRGQGQKLTQKLLEERAKDRERENGQ